MTTPTQQLAAAIKAGKVDAEWIREEVEWWSRFALMASVEVSKTAARVTFCRDHVACRCPPGGHRHDVEVFRISGGESVSIPLRLCTFATERFLEACATRSIEEEAA